ncbi:TPA: hypothetical protein JRS25_004131 [Escherichia coli]|nr:hypothetical protein [Escherichia coli]
MSEVDVKKGNIFNFLVKPTVEFVADVKIPSLDGGSVKVVLKANYMKASEFNAVMNSDNPDDIIIDNITDWVQDGVTANIPFSKEALSDLVDISPSAKYDISRAYTQEMLSYKEKK